MAALLMYELQPIVATAAVIIIGPRTFSYGRKLIF
jgi:hypothetical protein